jgi:hypothetical protein
MSFDLLAAGDSVLFVAPGTVNQAAFIQVRDSAQTKIGPSGQTAFEVFDRVSEGKFFHNVLKVVLIIPLSLIAPLAKSSYNTIYSNLFSPSVAVHQPSMFSRYLNTLSGGGRIFLQEVVLMDDLPNTVCPITRKSSDLESMLKLAGFVDVHMTELLPVTDDVLAAYFRLWGTTKVEQGVSRLSGKFGIVCIQARKPAYEVGQKMTLRFGNKKKKAALWTAVSTDDIEDEDALLDDIDRVKPSKESLSRKRTLILANLLYY